MANNACLPKNRFPYEKNGLLGQAGWDKIPSFAEIFSQGSPELIILILSEKVIKRGPLATEKGTKRGLNGDLVLKCVYLIN